MQIIEIGWAEPWSVEQRINCLELMMKYALGQPDIVCVCVRVDSGI